MVRLLLPEDIDLWKAIRLEALREHPAAFDDTYEEALLQSAREWQDSLNSSTVFVYMDEESPVGVAGYFTHQPKNKRHIATIFTVYVKQDYRGKGVTDWLLGAIAYHAGDTGIEQLHLAVGTYNTGAIRCYERNGFAVYGTEPRAMKLDGEYIDEYLMVKFL